MTYPEIDVGGAVTFFLQSDAGQRYVLRRGRCTVGSEDGADVVVPGRGIAAVHLALTVARDRVFCQTRSPDVAFSHNGAPVANAVLRDGDQLGLGDRQLTVVAERRALADGDEAGLLPEQPVLPEIVHPPHRQSTMESHHQRARETRESRQLVRHLDLMYRLAQLVNTTHDMTVFGDDLLALVLGVVPADRAYLVQFAANGGACVLASRFATSAPASTEPSQTILSRVRDQGISLITANASGDPRLDKSESIALAAITGAICVPMVHGDRILGAIYADGAGSVHDLNRDHLTVLESVASFVSVALHRAMLHHALEQRELHTHLLVHDMKNPLATVSSGLDLLRHQLGQLAPEVEQTVALVQRAGHQLDGYVSDILRGAQLEQGILEPNRAPVSLERFCQDVVERWAPTVRFQRRSLHFRVDPPMASWSFDAALMHRVVDNLLGNAVEYGPRDSTVDLLVRCADDTLELTVLDRGPGVPEAARKRIFTKFGRAEEQAVAGRGFGLFFCRLAVEAHGGTIAVQGGPGDNRFVCRLPGDVNRG